MERQSCVCYWDAWKGESGIEIWSSVWVMLTLRGLLDFEGSLRHSSEATDFISLVIRREIWSKEINYGLLKLSDTARARAQGYV